MIFAVVVDGNSANRAFSFAGAAADAFVFGNYICHNKYLRMFICFVRIILSQKFRVCNSYLKDFSICASVGLANSFDRLFPAAGVRHLVDFEIVIREYRIEVKRDVVGGHVGLSVG